MWSREVLCPWCDKKSMWTGSEDTTEKIVYKQNGRNIGQKVNCPKCGAEFVMLNDRLAGIFVDDVSVSGFEAVQR